MNNASHPAVRKIQDQAAAITAGTPFTLVWLGRSCYGQSWQVNHATEGTLLSPAEPEVALDSLREYAKFYRR